MNENPPSENENPPSESSRPDIDLDEVTRLVDALEADLARARHDSSHIEALRAEVEQLRAALGSDSEPDSVQNGLSGLRENLHRLGDELLADAFEGGRYITQIGRILGL
ncbi:MAG: hypothetical protein WCY32_01540 [Burkholderiaceae bacterium]